MRPKYKQLCVVCRKNHVVISSYRQQAVCVQCSMREIEEPVEDKRFKKLFDIDKELYEKSSFLRNVKYAYLRYKSLSDRQIEMFKKVAKELKTGEASEKE